MTQICKYAGSIYPYMLMAVWLIFAVSQAYLFSGMGVDLVHMDAEMNTYMHTYVHSFIHTHTDLFMSGYIHT